MPDVAVSESCATAYYWREDRSTADCSNQLPGRQWGHDAHSHVNTLRPTTWFSSLLHILDQHRDYCSSAALQQPKTFPDERDNVLHTVCNRWTSLKQTDYLPKSHYSNSPQRICHRSQNYTVHRRVDSKFNELFSGPQSTYFAILYAYLLCSELDKCSQNCENESKIKTNKLRYQVN